MTNQEVIDFFIGYKNKKKYSSTRVLHIDNNILYSYNEPIAFKLPYNDGMMYLVNTDYYEDSTIRKYQEKIKNTLILNECCYQLIFFPIFQELNINSILNLRAICSGVNNDDFVFSYRYGFEDQEYKVYRIKILSLNYYIVFDETIKYHDDDKSQFISLAIIQNSKKWHIVTQ